MSKNTSIYLDQYFENFIKEQVHSGRFSSASEVIRSALRLFELHEEKTKKLVSELKEGEKSEMISDFNRKKGLENLHSKHLKNEL